MLEGADPGQVADLTEGHEDVAVLPEEHEDDRHEEMGEAKDVEQDVRVAELNVVVLVPRPFVEHSEKEVLVNANIAEFEDKDGKEKRNESPLVGLVLVVMELAHLVQDEGDADDHGQADSAEYQKLAYEVGFQHFVNVADLELDPMQVGVLLDENDVRVDAEYLQTHREELYGIEKALQHPLFLEKAFVFTPSVAGLVEDLGDRSILLHSNQENDGDDLEDDVLDKQVRRESAHLVDHCDETHQHLLYDR